MIITHDKMNRKSINYLQQTLLIAELSKDPSTKVGALIIDDRGRVVSQGRNGFPMGVRDVLIDRDRKLFRTLHAELNAILFATTDLENCTIYVSAPPCAQCMAAIIQVGIIRVICYAPEKEFEGRWKKSCNEAIQLTQEAGIIFIQVINPCTKKITEPLKQKFLKNFNMAIINLKLKLLVNLLKFWKSCRKVWRSLIQ